MESCPNCGKAGCTSAQETQTFCYGPEAVELTATVPVFHCLRCDFAWTDSVGETLRTEAICRHLRVLTPDEIRAVRVNAMLGQAEFAAILGVTEAHLRHLEFGVKLPNRSEDTLLRLLQHSDNINRLCVIRAEGLIDHCTQCGERLPKPSPSGAVCEVCDILAPV